VPMFLAYLFFPIRATYPAFFFLDSSGNIW
jgi:hypothetical protein